MDGLFPVVLVGCGNMGTALGRGLRTADAAGEIRLVEPNARRREQLESEGLGRSYELEAALAGAATVVVAVKPQMFSAVAARLKGRIEPGTVVVSIMAGVPTGRLREELACASVVRTMPNLPLTVGMGATAIAVDGLSEALVARARALMSAAGETVEVSESQIDAVTGLSGSAPAFVLRFLMALEDGGVLAGLPRPVARRLALATLEGTGRMARESGLPWDELRGQVTSPGGTTIHGLHALEVGGFPAAVMDAVAKATERSRELGR